jgi:hypothetical protein
MRRLKTAIATVVTTGLWPVAVPAAELAALAPSVIQVPLQTQRALAEPLAAPEKSAEGIYVPLKFDRSTTAAAPSAARGWYRLAPEAAPSAPSQGLRYENERPVAADARPEEQRYELSSYSGVASALKAAPTSVMNRPGWNWSGRVGPMRWLGPIDGEGGETTLRLGRVPGQPRVSGLGKFHVVVHYTFE